MTCGRDALRDAGSQDVGQRQDALAPPPVDQDAGERPDERVGHQQRREAGGDVGGVALTLGVEQHRAGQAGLEDAVGELPGEPDGEQATEGQPAQREPQISTPLHLDDSSHSAPLPTQCQVGAAPRWISPPEQPR
jgi:hypothetical protein